MKPTQEKTMEWERKYDELWDEYFNQNSPMKKRIKLFIQKLLQQKGISIEPLVCNFTEMEIFTNTFGISGPERDLIKIGRKLNEVIDFINKNGK